MFYTCKCTFVICYLTGIERRYKTPNNMFGTCTCLRIFITIQNLRLARDCFGDLVKIKKNIKCTTKINRFSISYLTTDIKDMRGKNVWFGFLYPLLTTYTLDSHSVN